MSVEQRRFPPPWTAEETDACFIVKDHNGMAVAYAYFEDEPGRRTAANLLRRDEARRIAANIARLARASEAAAVLISRCRSTRKALEPRGAITPGVPGLRLKLGS